MMVTTLNSKTFRLEKSKRKLAELRFPSIWSQRVEAEVPNGELEILSGGSMSNKYHYLLNELDRGTLKVNLWSGKTILEVHWKEDEAPTTYRLKSKWTGSKFTLLDEQEQALLIIKAKMSWRKLSYRFELEWIKQMEDEDQAVELAVYALHAAKVKLAMQSG
ncbi:MAG: hypothetical protein AAF544_09515 [Bacteroidota bacterium]